MSTKEYKCLQCGNAFLARTADRKRGWARFDSKSCKAKYQEKRTGQYSKFLGSMSGSSEFVFPSFEEGGVQ